LADWDDILKCPRCEEKRELEELGGGYTGFLYLVCDSCREVEYYGTGGKLGYETLPEHVAAWRRVKDYAEIRYPA